MSINEIVENLKKVLISPKIPKKSLHKNKKKISNKYSKKEPKTYTLSITDDLVIENDYMYLKSCRNMRNSEIDEENVIRLENWYNSKKYHKSILK